jgi:hypothetical protein
MGSRFAAAEPPGDLVPADGFEGPKHGDAQLADAWLQ